MRRGFTIMEMLVTVTIIGVLATVAIPSYSIHIERMRASEAIQILVSLLTSQEHYKFDNGAYTNNIANLDITIPASASFQAPVVAANPVACVDRRADGGGNFYSLCILSSGLIDCTNDGAPAIGCNQLGSMVTGTIH